MNELYNKIFSIDNEETFNKVALEIFRYQFDSIPVYRSFVKQLNKENPTHYTEIPFLPISFFKTHRVCKKDIQEEIRFLSSGTTGQVRSQHFVEDISLYNRSFEKTYNLLIGNPKNQVVLALLPNYLEQGDSSLVYMVDSLIKKSNNVLSGFLLNKPEEIYERYENAVKQNKEIIIFGVSYALLDLAEKGYSLSQATIIETGGMKGRRKELSKEELHTILKEGLNVSYISSEYGMTELLSQAYSNKNGFFECPPWMKICIRDVNDPFSFVPEGKSGGINVIDLANVNSCSFIATEDLGQKLNDTFRILGRIDLSDIRGCNLLIQ
jgi:hypothetical protein